MGLTQENFMQLPVVQTLENGIRLVTQKMESARSVSLGVWLAQGSRDEAPRENGMTHFAEHMLFKGTGRSHWRDISRRMNILGGSFNACTSAEWVKLYGRVISRDLTPAMDLVEEMFLDSTFPEEEITREREVILEEIAMYEDVPEDLCFELYTQALLLPHPIGRPVIGTEELVSSFSADELRDYWKRVNVGDRMIISICGAFDDEELLALCRRFERIPASSGERQHGIGKAEGNNQVVVVDRDLEQVNFCLGMLGPTRHGDQRFAWALYDTILGGGMGSRLFDEVREKRGLAYSIGSSTTPMRDIGYLTISGSTRPDTATTAIKICLEEIEKLAAEGPADHEMDTARQQLERGHLLASESNGVMANINGEREIYGMTHLTPDEVLEKIAAVTSDDVQAVAKIITAYGKPAACLVGPLGDVPGIEEILPGAVASL